MIENLDVDVSVVIPIHGNPIYLNLTLESLENQSIDNFEVIAVLDRADLWVKTLLDSTTIKKRPVKVLMSGNPGISSALQLGILKSRGRMIARIDSDDTMESMRLELQLNYLNEHSAISIVGSQVNYINSRGLVRGSSNYPLSKTVIKAVLPVRNCLAHPSIMMRRSIFLSGHGYRSEFDGAEDYDLWLRALKNSGIVNMPQKLTNYRIWENQTTAIRKNKSKTLEERARGDYLFENGVRKGSFKFWRCLKTARCMDLALQRDDNSYKLIRLIYASFSFLLSPLRITLLILDLFLVSKRP